ncbi:MAG: hypothetical protein NHB36_02875 [Nitrospira sp.]|nr:hypothetical protein [Nitrospira sp.]
MAKVLRISSQMAVGLPGRLVVLLILSTGLSTGCSTIPGGQAQSLFHHSAKGTVYFQTIIDRSFIASHPATIDKAWLFSVLQGFMAEEVATASPSMPAVPAIPADGTTPMRMFSDEDAQYLAPLLADALSQAKPTQLVGFTVSPSAGSGAAPAAGIIFRHHDSIYVTISPRNGMRISALKKPNHAARVERIPAYSNDWIPGTLALVITPYSS